GSSRSAPKAKSACLVHPGCPRECKRGDPACRQSSALVEISADQRRGTPPRGPRRTVVHHHQFLSDLCSPPRGGGNRAYHRRAGWDRLIPRFSLPLVVGKPKKCSTWQGRAAEGSD